MSENNPQSTVGRWWRVLKLTATDFNSDNVMQLAAALAYYIIFASAPLLLIVIAVTGRFFGEQAVKGELYSQLEGYVGEEGAAFLQEMVKHAHRPGEGTIASIIAVIALVIGATGVMKQLKSSLNIIWDAETSSRWPYLQILIDRLIGLLMVLLVGVILLALIALNTAITVAQEWITEYIGWSSAALGWANGLASVFVAAVVFAAMFRYLPDTRVGWKHAIVGAIVTALLFHAGKYAFSWYISRGTIASTYGAAGSVLVVLLWAYYASLIVFIGAEFTQSHARVFGKPTGKRQ